MTDSAAHNLAVIWHDVECGGYGADLPLWRELAAEAGGPVLELGAGTGRVAIDLGRQGHDVTAVDSEPELIAVLRDRAKARDIEVGAHLADIRTLDLGPRFALAIAPMQVVQLLADASERRAMLASVARCVGPGGALAISIVEGVPAGGGEVEMLPDVAEIDGIVYSSLPLAIADSGDHMVVTRLRQVVTVGGDLSESVDETRLAVLDAGLVEAEARAVGLKAAGRREVATTAEHVGSTVVLLEAP